MKACLEFFKKPGLRFPGLRKQAFVSRNLAVLLQQGTNGPDRSHMYLPSVSGPSLALAATERNIWGLIQEGLRLVYIILNLRQLLFRTRLVSWSSVPSGEEVAVCCCYFFLPMFFFLAPPFFHVGNIKANITNWSISRSIIVLSWLFLVALPIAAGGGHVLHGLVKSVGQVMGTASYS